MTKLFFTLAAAAILAAPAAFAGDCATCGSGGGGARTWGPHAHKNERFTGWFHGGSQAPKLQPAPWFTYFPYNGQFMTPGPIGGPNGGPGGGMVNPYFPGH